MKEGNWILIFMKRYSSCESIVDTQLIRQIESLLSSRQFLFSDCEILGCSVFFVISYLMCFCFIVFDVPDSTIIKTEPQSPKRLREEDDFSLYEVDQCSLIASIVYVNTGASYI